MKKIEPTIIKETLYILVCVVILSVLMEAVFLFIRRWDYTVLLGNLLTGFAVTLNFFLMGLGVQKALGKDEKEAKKIIRLSQVYRYLILIVFLVIGVVFSCFNNWAVFVPVVFPRIAIAIRPLFNKKKGVQEVVGDVVPQESQEETKEQIQENTAQLEQQDVEE
ncbi:MAG: ATP synthase subunit I [Clostridia bacterium]|nr:ATP synthase subunit I [Clostridia bacterium]